MPPAAAIACRTLVVEDDPAGCEILVKVLRHLGHHPECATTVHHALRLFKQFQPSHVLLDLMLPDGNGAELLEYIRRNKLRVRVAVITAAGPGRFWDEAMRHNPDAVFKKPWDLNELRAFLQNEF